MKVYVLVTQIVYKYDDCGIETKVFATRDEAISALAKWKQDELDSLTGQGWTVESDTPDCFEIFLDGDWCCNHSCCYVEEFEL